ncbi:MAG: elongation factor P [Candidatus Omnitrophica bacterium]|nr:elongation factor P [Candidatus Omnitrophota bacterium]
MRVSDVKKGMFIDEDGEIYMVIDIEHRTPGNYQACYQLYLKHLLDSKIIKKRYNPDAVVEEAKIEKQKVQYLYQDNLGFHFMDAQTYDTITLATETVGELKNYLKENSEVNLLIYKNKPISLELPLKVSLRVIEAPVGLKGDTVGSAKKQVTLETGLKINVPLFIKEGDIIEIDTTTGEYLGRA